jgi:hypothetical protein
MALAVVFVAASPLVSSAAQLERTIVRDHGFGCIDPDYFRKLVEYEAHGSADQFVKNLSEDLMAGECTLFTRGEKVYVADTATVSGGLIQVRHAGDTREYWTDSDAIH